MCIVVGRSGVREPDYPGTAPSAYCAGRERLGYSTSIFLFAVSAALLTVATGRRCDQIYPRVGRVDFLVFELLMAVGGIFGAGGPRRYRRPGRVMAVR